MIYLKTAALEAGVLLGALGLTAAAVRGGAADLRWLVSAALLLTGLAGGGYAGSRVGRRWLRAGAAAAALGWLWVAGLLLSLAPELLTWGTLLRAGLLLLPALPASLLTCGWRAAGGETCSDPAVGENAAAGQKGLI
ncbi:MAG: hypothetical protein IK116_05375 [Firmicutes bacterium]|nr:hypothetical protein [Bacillota bacterium]